MGRFTVVKSNLLSQGERMKVRGTHGPREVRLALRKRAEL
jgi:hypothetical protein